jgi:hypothetical protein
MSAGSPAPGRSQQQLTVIRNAAMHDADARQLLEDIGRSADR